MTYPFIGLALTTIGTVGVGLIPYFGMAAGYGGPIVFRSPIWAGAWVIAWVVFIVGTVLTAVALCR